jgi:hypothetical protein
MEFVVGKEYKLKKNALINLDENDNEVIVPEGAIIVKKEDNERTDLLRFEYQGEEMVLINEEDLIEMYIEEV